MKQLEKDYTATNTKLLKHPDRLATAKKGLFQPITLEVAPTNKCNLNCNFCSVANRDTTQELNITELETALSTFQLIGLKSIEITGGGDPCLYPHINRLINTIHRQTTWPIGMITNGIALDKIQKINLQHLTWLRISLNALDQIQTKPYERKLLKLGLDDFQGTLGFSYVWNKTSDLNIILPLLRRFKLEFNAKYVRVVPNCLSVKDQKTFKDNIAKHFQEEGMFAQTKPYSIPENCYWGYFKPFLNADGYIYRCSACPLLDRKFPEDFRMGHMNDIIKIWKNAKPFKPTRCEPGKCFFAPQNQLIHEAITGGPHDDFI